MARALWPESILNGTGARARLSSFSFSLIWRSWLAITVNSIHRFWTETWHDSNIIIYMYAYKQIYHIHDDRQAHTHVSSSKNLTWAGTWTERIWQKYPTKYNQMKNNQIITMTTTAVNISWWFLLTNFSFSDSNSVVSSREHWAFNMYFVAVHGLCVPRWLLHNCNTIIILDLMTAFGCEVWGTISNLPVSLALALSLPLSLSRLPI